ncbi:MAG: AbrB/MazE/SpoVT family DNA-binding domain-containing protein [Caldilineaceae bacterium]
MLAKQEYIKTITTKGQVTIPIEIRRLLGVKANDQIRFRIVEGKVEIEPIAMTLEETFASVKPLQRPENFAELRAIAQEERAQRVLQKARA